MAGETQRPTWENSLGEYREYLRRLAAAKLEPSVRRKLDESDIVQQALLQAHRSIAQFTGSDRAQLAGWLRKILANELAQELRRLRTDKRDMGIEVPLQADWDTSIARVDAWAADGATSPSGHAIASENRDRIKRAMLLLSEAQREAISLHYIEGMKIAEICSVMQKSQTAVAGLIHRGLTSLREQMDVKI